MWNVFSVLEQEDLKWKGKDIKINFLFCFQWFGPSPILIQINGETDILNGS